MHFYQTVALPQDTITADIRLVRRTLKGQVFSGYPVTSALTTVPAAVLPSAKRWPGGPTGWNGGFI